MSDVCGQDFTMFPGQGHCTLLQLVPWYLAVAARCQGRADLHITGHLRRCCRDAQRCRSMAFLAYRKDSPRISYLASLLEQGKQWGLRGSSINATICYSAQVVEKPPYLQSQFQIYDIPTFTCVFSFECIQVSHRTNDLDKTCWDPDANVFEVLIP